MAFIGMKIDREEDSVLKAVAKRPGNETELPDLTDLSPWNCTLDALLRDVAGTY